MRLKLTYDKTGLDLQTLTREYTFSDIDMTSLRVDPASLDLSYPALGRAFAYATFEDGIERPVTRYVSWSTTSSDLLSIGSGMDGGVLTPVNATGRARVYANLTSASVGELEENITGDVSKQQ